MKNLAIIPARAGSKRIPDKNIRPFHGKPIMSYPIRTALDSDLFSEVMVSTDSEEIAALARQFGASVPFLRSAQTADDYAPLSDVVDEVAAILPNYDYYCLILSTAILLKPEHLKQGLQLIQNSSFDSVRPVVPFDYPIQKAFRKDKSNKIDFFYPENALKRSQDLEPAYHDSATYYWIRKGKQLKSPNKGAFVIPAKFVQDIDDYEDWELAEMKYSLLNNPE